MRRTLAVLAAILVLGPLTACEWLGSLGPSSAPATWALEADADLGPDTMEFVALVTEVGCASGRSAEGRVLPPDILYGERTITVTFSVEPLSGDHECPGNPATPVTVTLTQPLRDRRLLDGGLSPPAAPQPCED